MPSLHVGPLRYVHIPKTGGSWLGWMIRSARPALPVERMAHKHCPAWGGSALPRARTFTILRHPVAWWRSVYVNRCQHQATSPVLDLAACERAPAVRLFPELDEVLPPARSHTVDQWIEAALDSGLSHLWHSRYRVEETCGRWLLNDGDLGPCALGLLQEFFPGTAFSVPGRPPVREAQICVSPEVASRLVRAEAEAMARLGFRCH